MKGLICYFSTTGNTKLACEHINSKVNNISFDLYDITSNKEISLSDYDIVGFASYTDFLKPGKLMTSFIEKQDGRSKQTFVFNTYGQMSGNTLAILAKNVKASGFKLIEAYSLHVPENFPPLIKGGTTNENFPTEDDLKLYDDFIHSLDSKAEQLINGQTVPEKLVKGNAVITGITKFMGVLKVDDMGIKNVHEDLCSGCGICSRVCPYGAITMVNKIPSFNESKCRSCYACFNNCPTKSIYTKKLDGVGHYSKPHVNLIKKLVL